jgi:hypothetical protein
MVGKRLFVNKGSFRLFVQNLESMLAGEWKVAESEVAYIEWNKTRKTLTD